MRLIGYVVYALSGVLFLCGCSSEEASGLKPVEEAELARRLNEVEPAVAAYMGVAEASIREWWPGPVSPRNIEEARRAGLDERRVMSLEPTNLQGGPFTWVAWARFRLRGDALRRQYKATCFYNPSANSWRLDIVHVRAKAESPQGAPKRFWWLPVEPGE